MLTTPPRRHELTDEQWEKLESLLPPQKPHTGGQTRIIALSIINGILWILKTGAQWEDLPKRYGSSRTVSSRLYRGRKAGVGLGAYRASANGRYARRGPMDNSFRGRHQHSCSPERRWCKKGGPQDSLETEALG